MILSPLPNHFGSDRTASTPPRPSKTIPRHPRPPQTILSHPRSYRFSQGHSPPPPLHPKPSEAKEAIPPSPTVHPRTHDKPSQNILDLRKSFYMHASTHVRTRTRNLHTNGHAHMRRQTDIRTRAYIQNQVKIWETATCFSRRPRYSTHLVHDEELKS